LRKSRGGENKNDGEGVVFLGKRQNIRQKVGFREGATCTKQKRCDLVGRSRKNSRDENFLWSKGEVPKEETERGGKRKKDSSLQKPGIIRVGT